MNLSPHRRTALRALAASCAAWALPSARACEFHTGSLRITHPWTRATTGDAKAAVLCMRIDEVTEDDRLIDARMPLASGVEMGGPAEGAQVDVSIAAGSLVELHEAGVHLRFTGLTETLQVGREYPLTLEFERSGLVLARLSVDYTPLRFR